ncbi:unnamed protein product [Ixodes pacificus]
MQAQCLPFVRLSACGCNGSNSLVDHNGRADLLAELGELLPPLFELLPQTVRNHFIFDFVNFANFVVMFAEDVLHTAVGLLEFGNQQRHLEFFLFCCCRVFALKPFANLFEGFSYFSSPAVLLS